MCIAKNLTPLSHCPIAPSTILTGRIDFLEKLRNTRTPSDAELKSCPSIRMYWTRIRVISELRSLLVKTDAELLLRTAQNKQLRSAVDSRFVRNQPVQLWDSSRRFWINGPRFLSDSGRNAIIEHCGKLSKVPLAWIRARLVSKTEIVDLDPTTFPHNHSLSVEKPSGSGSAVPNLSSEGSSSSLGVDNPTGERRRIPPLIRKNRMMLLKFLIARRSDIFFDHLEVMLWIIMLYYILTGFCCPPTINPCLMCLNSP